MEEKKFIIIDSSAVLHRSWHALPKLTNSQGKPVNALYGFASLLIKLISQFQPQYLAATFDAPGPTFRHKIFKDYKATRIPQPQEFYDQIPPSKELLKVFHIKYYQKQGFEADDFIAQLKESAPKNILKIIVSGDLDLFQLIDPKTQVYFLKQGINTIQIYDKQAVEKRFGLSPQQLLDYKCLKGDPSDNIPGVPGIGDKTAKKLLKKFKTLENIYRHLESDKNSWQIKEKIGETLLAHRSDVYLAKKLSVLKKNPKIPVNFEKCYFPDPDIKEIKAYFEKLGFVSLIPRIEKIFSNKQQNKLF